MSPPDPRDLRTVATVGDLRSLLAIYPAALELAQVLVIEYEDAIDDYTPARLHVYGEDDLK